MSSDELHEAAVLMGQAMAHRGRDDNGVWIDQQSGVALSHRRLSIIDLSREGHQPMGSPSGRYTIVFNGEIYNCEALRAQIDRLGLGMRWRGHSDTEVFLGACDVWGVVGAVRRSNGMFAIAIWDSHASELILVRDRLGEKPLYFGWLGSVFLFGSELGVFEAFPGFNGTLDFEAVSSYLRFSYVPTPLSIYRSVRKLSPGCVATLRLGSGGGSGRERIESYWSLPIPDSAADVNPAEAVDRLQGMLRDAVSLRMHADVPLGVFLSGGIDSSTIAALAQEAGKGPVRTYSIGFDEKNHNEAVNALAVARALGTEHEELYVTASDALDVVPHLSSLFSEPFADSSQIPTYLLSKLTRRHVKVALSGDGGDELFGGYVRYLQSARLLGFSAVIPLQIRRVMADVIGIAARPFWSNLLAAGPRSLAVHFSAEHLRKLADVIKVSDEREMYKRLVSQWYDPRVIAPGLPSASVAVDDIKLGLGARSAVDWMMYMDQLTYLPDDILVKVDRASMAVGLEARVPFLDHRVVEYASQLPLSVKVRRGRGKWALRQVLYRYVNPSLVDRPKQGFGIPLATWLRGALREWAENLLSRSALLEHGIFDPVSVRSFWDAHLAKRGNFHHQLWAVLMLQSWLARTRSAVPHVGSAPINVSRKG